ncbi:MAG TPA: c-type cytochrome [Thermoanaerobaculia bacterium]
MDRKPFAPTVFALVPLSQAVLMSIGALAIGFLASQACRSRTLEQPRASFIEVPISPHPPATPKTRERGKKLYEANCEKCHGARGTGDGAAAAFLQPRPRDFTTGAYKYRTTEFGLLPTDADIYRTITRGLDGTSMPPWQEVLGNDERWALVDYIKDFSPRFAGEPPPESVPIPEPPRTKPDLESGKQLYAKLECGKCHGADGRGAGPSANFLNDLKGFHVNSRDFTDPASFRAGWTTREIVRTLKTGLNGTPLPLYIGLMSTKEDYDIAAYVMSLAKPVTSEPQRELAGTAGLTAPRVIRLQERAWKFEPAEIRVSRGEAVLIEFSVTDNGLGAGHGFAIDGREHSVFVNGTVVGKPRSVAFRIDEPGRYTYYCATDCSSNDLHPRMAGTLVVE